MEIRADTVTTVDKPEIALMSVQIKGGAGFAAVGPAARAPADGGRLLDAGLSQIVRDLNRAFTRSLQARIAVHGVTMGQWFFLRALWEQDGLTQRELSQRVGMMEPTTVTALNGMERRGLVQRVRNPHDRRKVNIFLTAKGRALRDVLVPCAREVNDIALDGVDPEEVGEFLALLRRMTVNLGNPGLLGGDDLAEDLD